MDDVSGDANDIWQTIVSFYSANIYPSYVLYKGFLSVYPYVWLYELSNVFGVGEFFFVKAFHSALFAYVSAVGLPFIIEKLLNIKAKNWRKIILILTVFWIWMPNGAFYQVMVDLPSLGYFVLLVVSAMKIDEKPLKLSIFRYAYTGLLVGFNFCISGQYTFPAVIILIYILIKSISKKNLLTWSVKENVISYLLVMIVCIGIVKGYNKYFEEAVVGSLREQGGWIPTAGSFFYRALLSSFDDLRKYSGAYIQDVRGIAVINSFYADQTEEARAVMLSGGTVSTVWEYIKILGRYPLDNIMRYLNRYFLALSPDGTRFEFFPLFTSYSLLYVALLSMQKRVKQVRDFFSANALIVLSFILALAAMMLTAIEYRYCMQLQGLVYAVAILDNTLWDGFKSFYSSIIDGYKQGTLGYHSFPFKFLWYILFVAFCLLHMSTLYDTIGGDGFSWVFSF